jgi:hypothetical protein
MPDLELANCFLDGACTMSFVGGGGYAKDKGRSRG